MLHMFSKNVEKNSSCCSQITEKHTHTHTHHVAADRSLLPESQNKSIFTSVVWLGRIHMRINSRAAIVVATDSTVQKSGGVRNGEDERKYCGGARQSPWGWGGGGGWRWADTNQNQKRTPWVYMTTADTCASVIWNDTTSELHDSCSSSSYLKMHFSPTNPNNRTLN